MVTRMKTVLPGVSLVAHAPPDLDQDDQIIGVCTVSGDYMHPGRYGWMAVDFLRWKTLLHGVGHSNNQSWLSRISMINFIKQCGGPYANDPGMAQHSENNIKVHEVPSDLSVAFRDAVLERARLAKERKRSLFVIVCGPASADMDICVQLDDPSIIISPKDLRKAIYDAVGEKDAPPVFLMVSSALTAGWTCQPILFDDVPLDQGDIVRLLARTCGSAFGNSIIDFFTSKPTPFLSAKGREKFPYHDLMPIGPSGTQVTTLHEFHAKIHETLKHQFSPLATEHDFNLTDSMLDTWGWVGLRETPLSWWAQRWHGKQKVKSAGFPFLVQSFGGCRETQIFHLKYLVNLELRTCPGDWENNSTGITRQLFEEFRNSPPSAIDGVMMMRILNAIEYRASCIRLAQAVVRVFKLPLPEGKDCRFWHDRLDDDDVLYKKRQLAFSHVNGLFDNMVLLPGEYHNEFGVVRFPRPYRWLAASLSLTDKDLKDDILSHFVENRVKKLLELVKQHQIDQLRANKTLSQFAKRWLQCITPNFEEDDAVLLPVTPRSTATEQLESTIQGGARPMTEAGHKKPEVQFEVPSAPKATATPKSDCALNSSTPPVNKVPAVRAEGGYETASRNQGYDQRPSPVAVATEKYAEPHDTHSKSTKQGEKDMRAVLSHSTASVGPTIAEANVGCPRFADQELLDTVFEAFSQKGFNIDETMPLVDEFLAKLSLQSLQKPTPAMDAPTAQPASAKSPLISCEAAATAAISTPVHPEDRSAQQEKKQHEVGDAKPKKFTWAEFSSSPQWRSM